MHKRKNSAGILIYRLLLALSVYGVVTNFMNDKPIMTALCCTAAIWVFSLMRSAESKKGAADDSAEFLKIAPEAKKLVDSVLKNGDIENIINNEALKNDGVKLVSVGHNNEINLVLTRDCVYEGEFKSYDYPARGVKNISYVKGIEFHNTVSQKLDEGRMAEMGFAVGGLGLAAMNAASAHEANANGGVKTNVATGYFFFDMKVRSENSNVYAMLIRKDYIEKFGDIFPDFHVKEGKYYNAYYVQLMKGGRCEKAGREMTELLRKIQQTD